MFTAWDVFERLGLKYIGGKNKKWFLVTLKGQLDVDGREESWSQSFVEKKRNDKEKSIVENFQEVDI